MVVALMGGLGNQLFQYAFGTGLAERTGRKVRYDRSRVDADGQRSYGLGAFALSIATQHRDAIQFLSGYGNVRGEHTFAFDPSVWDRDAGNTFLGYWQSEKYFGDKEKLMDRFAILSKPSSICEVVSSLIMSMGSDSCMLHVRRGDYLTPHNQGYHGAPGAEYYNEAIRRVRAVSPNAHFFVFSDDPAWCKTVYNGKDFTVVDCNKPGNGSAPGQEHWDLWLMSLCWHAIIANSSFSWWGAWFGDNTEKKPQRIVLAPSRWFVAQLDTKDLIPERWVKI